MKIGERCSGPLILRLQLSSILMCADVLPFRSIVDAVRVNLGMARGNVSLGKFMAVVNTDLDKLLDWKAR